MATATHPHDRAAPPPDAGPAEVAPWLEWLARLMDEAITVPGTGKKLAVGLDGLLGLLPGIGDAVSALTGLAFLSEARRLKASKRTQLKIIGNYVADFL